MLSNCKNLRFLYHATSCSGPNVFSTETQALCGTESVPGVGKCKTHQTLAGQIFSLMRCIFGSNCLNIRLSAARLFIISVHFIFKCHSYGCMHGLHLQWRWQKSRTLYNQQVVLRWSEYIEVIHNLTMTLLCSTISPGSCIVYSLRFGAIDQLGVHTFCARATLGCVTGYQVIRVIRIFAKTYPFE